MKRILGGLVVGALAMMGHAVMADEGVSIPVKLVFPDTGLASVGIYNEQGMLIRSLAYAKPVKEGEAEWAWDGTTDLGLPAVPGVYHVQGITFPEGPRIKYIMKVGLSGQPPYLTEDPNSGWGACHGPPTAICANASNLLAIFRVSESARETGIQVMDWEGKITAHFGGFFPFESRLACVMDDKNAYVAAWHASYGKKGLAIAKYDLANPPRGQVLCEIPVKEHWGTTGREAGRQLVDVQGLALLDGRLYVSLTLDDKIVMIDTGSGKMLGSSDLPSPRGLAVFEGIVFAITRTSLVALDKEGKPVASPIVTGLDDPSGLAVDAQGNFYVSERGTSQQVKIFTPKGKRKGTMGIPGGRPREGLYNPEGMLDPRGLCVAPDGRVWVAETAEDYEVLGAWNADGKPGKAFYNCHWSSGQGRLSPDRTELLFGSRAREANGGVSSYKIDLANGTWKPYWRLDMTPGKSGAIDQRDVLLGWRPMTDRERDVFSNHTPYLGFEKDMVQGDNGKTYLVGGDLSLYLFDPQTKRAKLASLIYTHHVEKTAEGPYQASYDSGKPNWLTWADLNGDGRMALDEVRCAENPVLLTGAPRIIDAEVRPDLSVMLLTSYGTNRNARTWALFRLKPHQVLADGVPVYDFKDIEKVTDLQMPDFNGGDRDPDRTVTRIGVAYMMMAEDSVYVRLEPGPKVKQHLTGIDGDGWWASRNWRITPERFDLKTGQPAWLKLGRRAPAFAKPGEMYYPGWGLAGSSHGVDFYADTISQVWAWTREGLYLGPVYTHRERGGQHDPNALSVELIGSYVYDINGKTYILTGDHGVYVHEMTLPERKPVDGGRVALTAEQGARVKPWDPDGPLPGKRPTQVIRSIFDYDKEVQKNTRTITVDGKLDRAEWENVPAMILKRSGETLGTVKVTFDVNNLYLAYDIKDANGLKNSGQELPYTPFTTGSYVDFSIAPDWKNPNRSENQEGDVRVIMARIESAATPAFQMGYWPVKQDLKKYKPSPKLNPQTIVSPVQQKAFDDISPVKGLVFAYQVSKEGYTLEAAVPFASLGFNPSRQPLVGFDVSAAFSDASGQVREGASHWAGESEAAVVDRPGSAELKPALWGTLQFDRTPLAPVSP